MREMHNTNIYIYQDIGKVLIVNLRPSRSYVLCNSTEFRRKFTVPSTKQGIINLFVGSGQVAQTVDVTFPLRKNTKKKRGWLFLKD